MNRYERNNRLIEEISEALERSVPLKHHVEVLAALRRAQELLGRVAPYVRNRAMADEAKLAAKLLDGFFWDVDNHPSAYFDISNGFDPKEYLKQKGILKS
jgi:hypothetical protein